MFSERFDEALAFAHQLHRRQQRKVSRTPFISHPLGVAAIVIDDGGSEDEAIAALLHDSLEDQGRHYPGGVPALASEIGRRFGPGVRQMVESLTERAAPEEARIPDKRERWRVHKLGYYAQVRAGGAGVRRISCADSLHNARTLLRDYRRIGERMWERFLTRNGDDQLWAYGTAAEMFRAAGVGPMADELSDTVEEIAEMRRRTQPAH